MLIQVWSPEHVGDKLIILQDTQDSIHVHVNH